MEVWRKSKVKQDKGVCRVLPGTAISHRPAMPVGAFQSFSRCYLWVDNLGKGCPKCEQHQKINAVKLGKADYALFKKLHHWELANNNSDTCNITTKVV